MAAIVYATRQDFDDFGGIPDGVLANPGREVASCTASTNTIELDAHGLQTDSPVQFRIADGGTLSAPLVAGTVYYAIRLSDSTFKVAAAPGGSAIDITTDGVNMIATKPIPIDRMLEAYSRWVEDCVPAHLVPFEQVDGAYPILIVKMVCQLAGVDLMHRGGKDSEVITKAAVEAKAQLERWAAGRPLRDPGITAGANLAVSTPLSVDVPDARGWGAAGGMLP